MGWFKRSSEGIKTETKDKKETPEGLWYKCPTCKTVVSADEHKNTLYVCVKCDHHEKLSAEQYFSLIFDKEKYTEFSKGLTSGDPLNFEDTKKYTDRVKATQAKTGLKDAIKTVHGKIDGQPFVVAAMDFKFIGGSLGSVMGEKISRAIDKAIALECPVMIIKYIYRYYSVLDIDFSVDMLIKTLARNKINIIVFEYCMCTNLYIIKGTRYKCR